MQQYRAPVERWPMRQLLQRPDGTAIEDAAAWSKRADEIRTLFLRTLGEPPGQPRLQGFEIGDAEPVERSGITRRAVRIEIDDNDVMPAWLLEPGDAALRDAPAQQKRVAIAFHGTLEAGKEDTAGFAPGSCVPAPAPGNKGPASGGQFPYGREMAERGWTVLVPDQLALKHRYARELKCYDTAHFYERFPKWSAIGKMVADGQACLDVLEQWDATAGTAVSVIGHSLGGQTALYVGALDDRVARVVCNCGVYPFADAAARAHWFRDEWYIYLKDPALKQSVIEGPQPLWDFHEIAALVAPRPLWLAMAPNDYCSQAHWGVMTMTAELHELWERLGATGNLTTLIHNEGHAFERWQRDFACAWLERPA